MYYFLPFVFINVIIFVINPCDPYSRFVGAESRVYLNHLNQFVLTYDHLLT